jgi:NAD dependent epimerase/dehydratase family enzyme
MKYKKIILAGGRGYLGTMFASYYSSIAEEVVILSRKPKAQEGNINTVLWGGINEGEWAQAMEGADMLINLCGKNVNCRYTRKNRQEICKV